MKREVLTGKQWKRGLEPALWENLVFVYQFKDLEHKPGTNWRFLSWKTKWSNWGRTSRSTYPTGVSLHITLCKVSIFFPFTAFTLQKIPTSDQCNHLLSRLLDSNLESDLLEETKQSCKMIHNKCGLQPEQVLSLAQQILSVPGPLPLLLPKEQLFLTFTVTLKPLYSTASHTSQLVSQVPSSQNNWDHQKRTVSILSTQA